MKKYHSCVPYTGGVVFYFAARSRHTRIVNVALCDGSIRSIQDTIDLTLWRSLSSPSNGETVTLP